MAKKERFITPFGTLIWPKLNTPDTYTPKRGAPKTRYVVNIGFEPEVTKKLQAFLKKKAKELLPDVKDPKLPIKADKEGRMYLTGTSGVKYRPAVFDAKNNKIPASVEIGGGTVARVDFTIAVFEISADNSGINLYINSVQVKELVESGFGKSNFDEVEDGFAYSGPPEEKEGFGSGAGEEVSEETDDDFTTL